MTQDGFFLKLAHRLPPRAWLAVAVLMGMLATGSGGVLYARLSDQHKDRLVLAYESIGSFMRETWRLTVSRENRSVEPVSDAVRVAPLGTLDPDAKFALVTDFKDLVVVSPVETAPEPVAPVRLLDPSWNPNFSPR